MSAKAKALGLFACFSAPAIARDRPDSAGAELPSLSRSRGGARWEFQKLNAELKSLAH